MLKERIINDKSVPFNELCAFCEVDSNRQTPKFGNIYGFSQEVAPMARKLRMAALLMDEMPVTEAHLLVVPYGHYTSAVLETDKGNLIKDTAESISFLKNIYPNRKVIAFEHGSGKVSNQKVKVCGDICDDAADHTHIHLMPAVSPAYAEENLAISHSTIRERVEWWLTTFGWAEVRDDEHYNESNELYGSLFNGFVNTEPYIWFHVSNPDGTSQESTFKQTSFRDRIPSQIMRRTMASLLYGRPVKSREWDYHELRRKIIHKGSEEEIPFLKDLINRFKAKAT